MQRTWCKPLPAADLLIQGGRVVDPESGVDAVQDVLIKKGKVAKTGKGLVAPEGTRVIDAAGMLVLPGFVDLHTHFRTPGREDEEDLATVSAAAAAGGYVAAFGMANTEPVTDSAVLLGGLARQAESDAVVPLGFYAAVTRVCAVSSSPRWASWERPAPSASATTAGRCPRRPSRGGRCSTPRWATASSPCTPRTSRSAPAARCTRALPPRASASPASRRCARAWTWPGRSTSRPTKTPACTSATSAPRSRCRR